MITVEKSVKNKAAPLFFLFLTVEKKKGVDKSFNWENFIHGWINVDIANYVFFPRFVNVENQERTSFYEIMFLLWFSQTRAKITKYHYFSVAFVLLLSLSNSLISLSEKPKSIFFVDRFLLVSSARIGKFQFQGFGKWFSISVLVLQFYFWLDLRIPCDFSCVLIYLIDPWACDLAFSSIWLIIGSRCCWFFFFLIFFSILESLYLEDFEN